MIAEQILLSLINIPVSPVYSFFYWNNQYYLLQAVGLTKFNIDIEGNIDQVTLVIDLPHQNYVLVFG